MFLTITSESESKDRQFVSTNKRRKWKENQKCYLVPDNRKRKWKWKQLAAANSLRIKESENRNKWHQLIKSESKNENRKTVKMAIEIIITS